MARRADHTPQELKEMILAQAEAIVESQGLSGLSARAVARAVGYSPGTLYNHFRNFDELVLSLNRRTLERLDAHLSGVPQGQGPQADVLALALAYFKFVEDNARLWNLMFEFRMQEPGELPQWLNQSVRKVLLRLDRALSPLYPEPESLSEAVETLWAGLHGIGSLAVSGKLEVVSQRSAACLAKRLVENFVRGAEQRSC